MASLLERELVVITGKGGTGKTTVACALGLVCAGNGRRTLVAELSGQRRVAQLLAGDREAFAPPHAQPPGAHVAGHTADCRPAVGEETQLDENLWSVSIDPDRAMADWLRTLIGRTSARVLVSSATFRYFAAAAPGAKELITMVKIAQLVERYDTVILDAPATGHALGMLRSPQTFAAIARVGPLASQSARVRRLLEDPARCGYVAVAHATEMAVSETLELEEGLRRLLDRDLDTVLVNGVLARRFSREERTRLDELDHADLLVRGAVEMARVAERRGRLQHAQIAKLRRQRFAGGAPPGVLTIPFQFGELDREAIRAIAERLGRRL